MDSGSAGLKQEDIKNAVIRFAGDSQDGIQSIGGFLARLAGRSAREVMTYMTIPSTISGGPSIFQVHLGSGKVLSPGDDADFLVVFYQHSYDNHINSLKEGGICLYDADNVEPDTSDKRFKFVPVPITSATVEALGGTSKDRGKNMFVLGLVTSIFGLDRNKLNEIIERTFTTESETIRTAVDELFDQRRPGVLSASVVIAIFTLSRGFAGLIRALDVAYDIEEGRQFIRLRATAIAMAVGTLATVAGSTALWVVLRQAGVPSPIRAMIALAILIVWAATMFHVGPHHRTPWRYDLPGAALTAIGWLLVSLGFGWYVSFAASGNEIVGAAGTALLALTWLWLACLVFLIGAELNEILAQRAGVIGAPKEFGLDVRGRVAGRYRSWRRTSDD